MVSASRLWDIAVEAFPPYAGVPGAHQPDDCVRIPVFVAELILA